MSNWKDFFDIFSETQPISVPGKIMVSFVNRYLEPMEDIKYKIVFESQEKVGVTTINQHSVQIEPNRTGFVKIYVWSKKNKNYKLIDTIVPKIGQPQLIYERMKTFKHTSQTHPHPVTSEPKKPTEAPRMMPEVAPATAQHIPVSGPSPKDNQGVNPSQIPNARGEPEHHADRPVPNKITVDQLKKIFPAAGEDYLQNIADELNTDLPKYKLDTILRRAHFFAQVREEAGASLKANEENLNYKLSALQPFKYYRMHPVEAQRDARIDDPHNKKKPLQLANQEAIANHAYGNREGNGDASTGDGWRYRGRGIFQLTFKNNYSAFENDYPIYWSGTSPNFSRNPEKIKEFPYNVRSAVWFWLSNKIYQIADKGSTDEIVEGVTSKINPGKLHLSHRQDNFKNLTYPAFK
jgi:predicted chitinase